MHKEGILILIRQAEIHGEMEIYVKTEFNQAKYLGHGRYVLNPHRIAQI